MSEQTIPIPSRLKNVAIGGHVAGSEDIDAGEGKTQKQVNDETNDTLALHQSEISGLNSQNYVSVSSYSSLPATGSADTIYRVSSWDGNANNGEGAADVTKYTQYAWNGTTYIVINVDTQIGEVFDISQYKAAGGTLATFEDLSAALDNGNNVPAGIRKGGMSIKFVQSSYKYVQYRLMSDSFNTTPANWQGVDDEPIIGSRNLIESNSIAINSLIPDCPLSNITLQRNKGYNHDGEPVFESNFCIAECVLTGREKYISALNKVTISNNDYPLAPLFVFFNDQNEIISMFNGKGSNIGKFLCSEIPNNCVKVGINLGKSLISNNKIRFFANDIEIFNYIKDNKDVVDAAIEVIGNKINEIENIILSKEPFSIVPLNSSLLTEDFWSDSYYMTPWNLAKLIHENQSKKIFISEFLYIPPGRSVNQLILCSIYVDANNILQQGEVKETISLDSATLVDGVYHVPFNKVIDYIPSVYQFKYKNSIGVEPHQGYIATSQNINTGGSGANGEMGFGAIGYLFSDVSDDIEELREGIEQAKEKIDKPLKGKIINILGDSITYQHRYIDYMVEKQGCVVNNYGISGTTISSEFSDSFVSRYSAMTNDCDIVVVFGGINDWNKGGVLGTFEDTNGNTFYSSLHTLIGGLKDKYINGSIQKPVFVCTPLHSQFTLSGYTDKLEYTITDGVISANSYGNGATLKEYVEAIRKVCEYYAVPIIDLYALSNLAPIQSNNNTKYYEDGLHPKTAGGKLIGNIILNIISEYIKNL